MSKELNIIEAMKMPIESKFGVFINGKRIYNVIIKSDSNKGKALFLDNRAIIKVTVTDSILNAKFIPIKQSVSFIDAITNKDNRRIKVDATKLNIAEDSYCVLNEYWNNTYHTVKEILEMFSNYNNKAMLKRIITECSWYIED